MPFMGLLTVGLISAGAQLYGAHKQAGAAKDAAGQQVDASNQAKAELRPIYEGNVARMQPYASLGGSAVGQLRALGGYPDAPPPSGGPVQIPFANQPMTAEQLANSPRPMMVGPDGKPLGLPGQSSPTMGSLGGGGTSAYGSGASGPPAGRGGSMPAQGPAMIMVMSPDGDVGQIPEAAWPAAQAAGGKRV